MNLARDTRLELSAKVELLCMALFNQEPSLKLKCQWRFGSNGSLSIITSGPKSGLWFNHEVGEGGDALDLIASVKSADRNGALAWARKWLGENMEARPRSCAIAGGAKADVDDRTSRIRLAVKLWREAVDPAGNLPQRYLESRGLALPASAPLRFHPACPLGNERLPAMLALMSNPVSGEAIGIHRTYLKVDGSGKADVPRPKMMLGRAGVVRLVPDEEITSGLGICEGIETGLSLMQGAGWRPVWVAGSAGAVARFPVLTGIESLSVFCDRDDNGAGLRAAHECARRWSRAGLEAAVQEPPDGKDWLDSLARSR